MRIKSRASLIIVAIIAVVAIIVAVSLVVRVSKLETTNTVGNYLLSYEVGKLDDSDGRPMSTAEKEDFEENGYLYNGYMHLKEFVNADGLKIKLADNAKVEYKVFFYNENYVLVDDTGSTYLTVDFTASDFLATSSSSSSVKYAKVEVKPIGDKTGTIDIGEISKYGKMLSITYNKFDE